MRIAAIAILLVLLIPVASANHGGSANFTTVSGSWNLEITGSYNMDCNAFLINPSGTYESVGGRVGGGTSTNRFKLGSQTPGVAYKLWHNCTRVCPTGYYVTPQNTCIEACPTGQHATLNPYYNQGFDRWECRSSHPGSGAGSYSNQYGCPQASQTCYQCTGGTYFDTNTWTCTRYYSGDGICQADIGEPSSTVDCVDKCAMACNGEGDAATNDAGSPGQCIPEQNTGMYVPCTNEPWKWCWSTGSCDTIGCYMPGNIDTTPADFVQWTCGSTGNSPPQGTGGSGGCAGEDSICDAQTPCCGPLVCVDENNIPIEGYARGGGTCQSEALL